MSQWSSRLGFVFAVVGSAVGLGNVWRFPFLVGENGGGAFLIPYLLITFVFGVPLMIVAISAGEKIGADLVTSFSGLGRGYFGWIIVAVSTVILSYYLVVTGWVLAFIWFSITGFATSFGEFTSSLQPLFFWLAALAFTAFIVSYGIEDGIERAATVFIPVIFFFLLVLAVYNITLDGFAEGVSFFLSPDFGVLTNPGIWRSAFGQAFFSLSMGMGILLTYGSYIGSKMDIPKLSVIITVANFSVAILAGFVIFPVVTTFGLKPASGAKLALVTLPKAFQGLPIGGLVGAVFFSLLFLAAISSAISLLEVAVSVGIGKGLSRKKSIAVMLGLLFILGLPSALSYTSIGFTVTQQPFLDLVDGIVGDIALPATSLIIAVTFTWLTRRKITEIEIVNKIVKYVVPVALIIILATNLL